jgi:hypothetical protein
VGRAAVRHRDNTNYAAPGWVEARRAKGSSEKNA